MASPSDDIRSRLNHVMASWAPIVSLIVSLGLIVNIAAFNITHPAVNVLKLEGGR
jgi:hypothetical protein